MQHLTNTRQKRLQKRLAASAQARLSKKEREAKKQDIRNASFDVRKDILHMLHEAGSGHAGGSLSVIDLLLVLYKEILVHDPKNPDWEKRDRFVLSAGHLCPALYAVLADEAYFPKKELSSLRKHGSRLQGHPEMLRLSGVENTSGPLGQGVTLAVGKALAAKRDKKDFLVYALASDGEHDEGAVWESVQIAAHHKLGNLCLIIDRNNVQIDGKTSDILALGDLKKKYLSFGWDVMEIDGHNVTQIADTLEYFAVRNHEGRPPLCIIAKTIIGKYVSFMENNPLWHGKVPNTEETIAACKELDERKNRKNLKYSLQLKEVLS